MQGTSLLWYPCFLSGILGRLCHIRSLSLATGYDCVHLHSAQICISKITVSSPCLGWVYLLVCVLWTNDRLCANRAIRRLWSLEGTSSFETEEIPCKSAQYRADFVFFLFRGTSYAYDWPLTRLTWRSQTHSLSRKLKDLKREKYINARCTHRVEVKAHTTSNGLPLTALPWRTGETFRGK